MSFKSRLELIVDSRTGEQSLKRFDSQLAKTDKQGRALSSTMGDVTQRAKRLKTGITATAMAASGAAIGIAAYTKAGMDAVDAQAKLARQLDSTIGGLRGLQLAANDAGVSTGVINSAMERFSARLGEAQRGTGQAAEALERLNLRARDLAEMDVDKRVAAIADSIHGMGLSGAETADVLRQFGIRNREIVNLMRQGGDAVRDARGEIEDYGLAVSDIDAAGIEAANDAISRAQLVSEGLSQAIATELAPALLVVAERFNDSAREAGGWSDVVVDSMRTGAESVAPVLDAISWINKQLDATGLAAQQFGVGMRAVMADVAATIVEMPVQAVNYLGQALNKLPGVSDIELLAQPDWTKGLRNSANAAYDEVSRLENQIHEALDRPLAGDKLLEFLSDVEDRSKKLTAAVEHPAEGFRTLDGWMGTLNTTAAETSEEFDKLRGTLDASYKAQQDYADQIAVLDDELAEGRINQKLYNDLKAIAKKNLDDATKAASSNTKATKAAAKADKEAAKATANQANELESLRGELDPAYAAGQKLAESTELLDAGLANGTVTLTEYLDLWDKAADVYGEATTGTDDQAKSLEALAGKYDQHHQKAAQLEKDLKAINKQYKAGEIGGQKYQRMVGNVREEMRELALESDPIAKEMARSWEEAGKRIDETFADAFTGAFDSFEDFGDQLLDGFKRLLGELAYQATLKPIVVNFTGQMQDMLGIGGSGGVASLAGSGSGGLGSIASVGNQVGNWLGISSGAGTAAGYTGALGSATGAYGGWAGSATAGAAASGGTLAGIGSAASTALPWVGAGLAVDNMLDLGIGDAISSGLDSIAGALGLGHSPTPFSGRFGTTESLSRSEGAGSDGVFEHQGGGRFHGQSALGYVGFRDVGTERLQRAGTGDKQWAEDLVDASVEMDNLVASLASSEVEMRAMQAAVQGLEKSSRSAGSIVDFALKDRPREALDALGGQFGEFVDSLSGSIEEVVAKAQAGRQAFSLLSAGADRLNLTFDETASGALKASSNIAELVGGMQNLGQLQTSYYQQYFTEAERAANLQSDLTDTLAEQNLQLPESKEAYRELVEAQNLNTQSGRENYAVLLELAGGFDQLQQQMSALSETTATIDLSGVKSAYEALRESISAEQDILREAHQQTTRSIRDNMRTVESAMRSTERLASGLQSTLDGMVRQGGGLASSRESAQAYLRSVQASGGLGDPEQLERALGVAAEPSEQLFGSFEDYQRDFWATANIVDQLNDRASEQLTTEERGLRALERQIDQADRQFEREMSALDASLATEQAALEAQFGQLDWLSTLNDSVLSITDALGALDLAADKASGGSGDTSSAINRAYQDILGREADDSGIAYYAGAGFSLSEIRARLKDSDEANPGRIPGFASGGYHIGGPRVVGERGPELEVTGPSRIVSNHDTKKLFDLGPLVREVVALRQEVADLKGYARVSSNNAAKIGGVIRRWQESGITIDEA